MPSWLTINHCKTLDDLCSSKMNVTDVLFFQKEHIFAGVEQTRSGNLVPTGVGRLCNWTPDPDQSPADEFVSFGAYQRTLTLICDHGEPGVIQWTPDEDTPDTVYYQV